MTGAAFLHSASAISSAARRAFATATNTGVVRTPRTPPSAATTRATATATASASTTPPAMEVRPAHHHSPLCRTYPPSLHSHRTTTFQASEKRHCTTAPDEARTATKTWAPQASCGVINYPMALLTPPSSSGSSLEIASVMSTTILASSITVLPVYYSYVEMPPSLPSSPLVTFRSTDDDDDPETTLNRVVHSNGSGTADALHMSSTLKKRRAKMNKHKLKKRRKLLRLKSK